MKDMDQETASLLKNVLDNFSHGRRVFALEQLEAAVGHHDAASQSMKFFEHRLDTLTWKLEDAKETLHALSNSA